MIPKIYNAAMKRLNMLGDMARRKRRMSQIAQFKLRDLNAKRTDVSAEPILQIVPTEKNTRIIGSNWLASFKNNRFSEHGEDGIIAKIFEIMPPENKWVCEFGAHDPEIISNTWRLIHQEGWNALLIEADDYYYDKLKKYYEKSQSVHCVHTKVSYEGSEKLDNILQKTPVPKDLDFMIIDIDGNDYHVWQAIEHYRAKLVMIEFNASIPTDVSFIQERNLSVNHGSSLRAMYELAAKKGYKLIAATSWNAFFIREEYFSLFFDHEPALDQMYVFPVKHPIWMRPFQLYDGTIMVAPWDEMLWHKVNLKVADYQVLPESMRAFNRELATQDFIIETDGKKSSVIAENAEHNSKILSMPGNILGKYAKNNYSRHGEDGITDRLASAIGINHHYFVDVGAWDGITYSRSRDSAVNAGWRGIALENDEKLREELIKSYSTYPSIHVHHGSFGMENDTSLNSILKMYDAPRDFDFLFLNTFGMEYYLWESLTDYEPKVVVVQFNPTIPNDVKFIQPKDSSVNQGSSLRAFLDLAHYKNYELVATTLESAFFVHRKHFYRLFESQGLKYADLDEMFCPVEMQLFQLYDGTIELAGLDRLFWHNIRIDKDKLQVIPRALRTFHQFADKEHKKYFYRVA